MTIRLELGFNRSWLSILIAIAMMIGAVIASVAMNVFVVKWNRPTSKVHHSIRRREMLS